MKQGIRLVAIAMLSLVAACGGGGTSSPDPTSAPAAPAAGDPAAGKIAYDASCTACHGPDAKGLPNLGKDLVTSEFALSTSDADLVAFIKVGRSVSDPANTTGLDMPAKGGNPSLSDGDLADIVAYLRQLEG